MCLNMALMCFQNPFKTIGLLTLVYYTDCMHLFSSLTFN